MAIAIDWASKEGWNPGLDDASAYYEADSSGFLIGKIGDEPIATISAVKYGRTFGFIGFYIVKEAFRGKGHGLEIWEAAISRLKGRTMGLDGVIEQQHNYRKSGFRLAHRNMRFAGKSVKGGGHANNMVRVKDIGLSLLGAYDRSFFPAARSLFLENWIKQARTHTLIIPGNTEILGYGCIRSCRFRHLSRCAGTQSKGNRYCM